jgi:hypothetical protein
MATVAQRIFKANVYGKKAQMKKGINAQKKGLEGSLQNIPTYEIPQEATDYLKMLEQTSQDLEGTQKPYDEAVQIARNKASMGEAPGSELARQDIQQSTAGQIQNIKEAGGGGVNALGAIAKTGMSEQAALRDLAKTNLQYQENADQNLQGSLMGQSQNKANLLQQQAALKGAGLQSMVGEKGKQYQSNLDKYLTMTEYQINQLGLSQADLESLKNRRAQMASSIVSGLTGMATSYLTGGLAGKK